MLFATRSCSTQACELRVFPFATLWTYGDRPKYSGGHKLFALLGKIWANRALSSTLGAKDILVSWLIMAIRRSYPSSGAIRPRLFVLVGESAGPNMFYAVLRIVSETNGSITLDSSPRVGRLHGIVRVIPVILGHGPTTQKSYPAY